MAAPCAWEEVEVKGRGSKALGITTLLAIALVAAMGASSASATALCAEPATEEEETCGTPYEANTTFSGEATNTLFDTSSVDVVCAKSVAEGETTEAATGEGSPLGAEVTALSFEGCETTLGMSCEVTTTSVPDTASLSWVSGNDGTLSISNVGGTIVCGSLSCTTSAEKLELDANGGAPASVVANKETMKMSGGFLCPTSVQWSATFALTAPAMAYVTQEAKVTKLCEVETVNPCNSPYPVNTEFELNGATAAFDFAFKAKAEKIACTTSSMKFRNTKKEGAPLPGELLTMPFSNCNNNNCTAEMQNLAYKIEIASEGGKSKNGTIKFHAGAPGGIKIKVACGATIPGCTYWPNVDGVLGEIIGGATGQIKYEFEFKVKDPDTHKDCGQTLTFSNTYSFAKPKTGVWVSRG